MPRRRRIIGILIFISFCFVLVLAQEPGQDAPKTVANYYIENAHEETGSVNIVTSIYLNYRYYDTLFEALMLLFSIIGVIYMSVHEGGDYDE